MTIESISEGSSAHTRGWHSVQKPTHKIEEITFDDVVNAVNPLNHLPFISNLTAQEDRPSPVSRMLVGTLLGGVFGLVSSAVDIIFEDATGKGVVGNVVASITDGKPENSDMQIASRKYQSIANAHKRHFNTWSA